MSKAQEVLRKQALDAHENSKAARVFLVGKATELEDRPGVGGRGRHGERSPNGAKFDVHTGEVEQPKVKEPPPPEEPAKPETPEVDKISEAQSALRRFTRDLRGILSS